MTAGLGADVITAGVAELGQALPGKAAAELGELIDELMRWNRRMNLTAVRNAADALPRHLLDSLSVRPHLRGERVLDIGTGAGFPGLPLAIAEPDRHFVLLDSNARKIGFVQHMITRLGLDNAEAARARAEDYAGGPRFATVIARAVTSLSGLLELGGHLVGEDGVLLAMKGRCPDEELDALPDDWISTVTELHVPGLARDSRHLITLKRRVQA